MAALNLFHPVEPIRSPYAATHRGSASALLLADIQALFILALSYTINARGGLLIQKKDLGSIFLVTNFVT